MLTREQINLIRIMIRERMDTHWLPDICNQASRAIDLAAENAEMLEHIYDIEFERSTLIHKVEELEEDQRRGNQKMKEIETACGKLQSENEHLKEKNLYLLANLKLADTEYAEQLKGKLDEVRRLAEFWTVNTTGSLHYTAQYLNARAADILAILDKEDAT